jgi:hypothetical protein
MLWLGLRGRKAIADLNARLEATEEALHKLQQSFTALDLDMTSQVDRLAGIAKRIQGRRGGRPPGEKNGDSEPEAELPLGNGFSRHVL